MFSQINIINNFEYLQHSEDIKDWQMIKRVQWMNLFQPIIPGDMIPNLITENVYSPEMIKYHYIMVFNGLMKVLWVQLNSCLNGIN